MPIRPTMRTLLEQWFCATAHSRAYRTGDFLLRSGRRSPHYLDLDLVCLDPGNFRLIGRLLWAVALESGWDVRALAGVAMGGIAPALALAQAAEDDDLMWPTLVIRPHEPARASQRRIVGADGYPPGTPKRPRGGVLVVEDVVTSGGASLEAVSVLRAAGYEPVGVLALVDRQEGAGAALASAGVGLRYAVTLADVANPPPPADVSDVTDASELGVRASAATEDV